MNKRIVPIILLAVVALSQGCGGQAEYLERFKVEPQRYYKLTLEPEDGVGEGRWLIHQFTADGSLPFDGVYEFDWQCLQAGRSSYEHAFLTHSEAVEVGVALRDVKGDVRLKALKLAELDVPGLILNGDFSMGADNWSGWSQVNLCELVSDGAGGQSLLVRQNGYALSDYFPLAGGGGYTVPRGVSTSHMVWDTSVTTIHPALMRWPTARPSTTAIWLPWVAIWPTPRASPRMRGSTTSGMPTGWRSGSLRG